jgi:hypothetical protein
MAMSNFSKSSAAFFPLCERSSLLPFVCMVNKTDKVDVPDAEKYECIKLQFLMDPENSACGSEITPKVCYLQGWMPRGVYKVFTGLVFFFEMENLMLLKEPADKTSMC